MAFFSFAEGSAMFDSTPIENLFLLEHLPTAPEGCLRVYLYARVLALHPELGGDMAETARALRMDEDAVYDAFAYWERQGLVRRLTDRPPTYELLPVRAEGINPANPMERDYYAYRDFNASLQALFEYKAIDPHDYRLANDWLNVLGYEQDAVLRLVEYGKKTARLDNPSPSSVFKRMDKLAAAWADRGCHTLADVERAIALEEDVYPVAQAVLKRFSLRRKPTMDELDCVKRWVGEWKFTQAQILEACGETTKSRQPSFAYLDAVLKSRMTDVNAYWSEAGEALRALEGPQAKPSEDELKRYAGLRAQGFDAETVKLAAVQCRRMKKTRFEDVEWMLGQWGKDGVYTHEAAEAYLDRSQRKKAQVRALLEAAGSERVPKKRDMELFDGWSAKYDRALIDYAAQCASEAHAQIPFSYMDRLLTEWAAAGAADADAARTLREAGRARRAAAGRPGPAANPALDYAQREYNDEDFGDDFFIDLDKYGEGGDGK